MSAAVNPHCQNIDVNIFCSVFSFGCLFVSISNRVVDNYFLSELNAFAFVAESRCTFLATVKIQIVFSDSH